MPSTSCTTKTQKRILPTRSPNLPKAPDCRCRRSSARACRTDFDMGEVFELPQRTHAVQHAVAVQEGRREAR